MADETQETVVPLKAGDFCWYVRPGEKMCRPARFLSDGVSEARRLPNGTMQQFAHLEYGTLDEGHVLLGFPDPKGAERVPGLVQTHEVTAQWDPTGNPGTWHLPGEAPMLAHPDLHPDHPDRQDDHQSP